MTIEMHDPVGTLLRELEMPGITQESVGLTRRIQQQLAEAGKHGRTRAASPSPVVPPPAGDGQEDAPLATMLIQ